MSKLVFWAVTPCGLAGRYQRFGRTYCLHLHRFEKLKFHITLNKVVWCKLKEKGTLKDWKQYRLNEISTTLTGHCKPRSSKEYKHRKKQYITNICDIKIVAKESAASSTQNQDEKQLDVRVQYRELNSIGERYRKKRHFNSVCNYPCSFPQA
jgi:hypothetical protein